MVIGETTQRSARTAGLAFVLMAGGAASAAPGQPVGADPALEARVNRLASELRCLVCQNQSLADSHADLAVDLKNQVREQLRAGRDEGEVMAYMTDRYGDFVLYRPPLKSTTALLWGGPLILLAAGAWLLHRALRSREREPAQAPTDEATVRADRLLSGSSKPVPPSP